MNGNSSSRTRENGIKTGMEYLEHVLNTEPFPFSSNYFGSHRSTLIQACECGEFEYKNCGEKFNQYLLLDLLGKNLPPAFRSKLIQKVLPPKSHLVNFFRNPGSFPDDTETTALCYKALLKANAVTETDTEEIAEKIFSRVNDEGVVQMYFVGKEHKRFNRMDCTSTCNVLDFAYTIRQEHRVKKTEDFIFSFLESGEYKQGSVYYPTIRVFLYFCSEFAKSNHEVRRRFMPLLRQAWSDNQEDIKYPLDYALEVLTKKNLGEPILTKDKNLDDLLKIQNDDGSWPVDAFYATFKARIYFGSRELSTMFALAALLTADGENEI